MESIKIVLLCVFCACFYGVVHDTITAFVCLEYYTIAHPMLLPLETPVLLGIQWGIVASWWVGLLLGIPLAFASRMGSRAKIDSNELIPPIQNLMGILLCVSLFAGTIGFLAAKLGWVYVLPPLSQQIPAGKHARFLFDLWSHTTSYLFGVLGGIMLIVKTWKKRAQNEGR